MATPRACQGGRWVPHLRPPMPGLDFGGVPCKRARCRAPESLVLHGISSICTDAPFFAKRFASVAAGE